MAKQNNYEGIGKKIALALAGIMTATALITSCTALALGAKHNGWFEKEPTEQETQVEETEANTEFLQAGNIVNHSRLSLVQTLSDDGISAQAEDSVTFSATVKDSDGMSPSSIQKVVWSMAWASGGTGNVSDYVTMTTNGTSATFAVKQAFGTQIIVTCASELDNSIKATATLDYYARIEGITVKMGSGTPSAVTEGGVVNANFFSFSETDKWSTYNMDFAYAIASSVGTKSIDGMSYGLTIEATDTFATKMTSAGYSGAYYNEYDISGGNISEVLTQASFFSEFGISNITSTNAYTFLDLIKSNTNQFKVTLEAWGHNQNFSISYYLNVTVDDAAISSVILDQNSYTF